MATEWYPEGDFDQLLQSLAAVLQQDGMKDVWDYFGRVAAQRDLVGSQELIPPERRVKSAGIYKPFVGEEGASAASTFTRLSKLWTLYHDSGQLSSGRSATHAGSVIVRVTGFRFPSRNSLRMLTSYLAEYACILGTKVEARIVRSTCDGDSLSEWEFRCEQRPEIFQSLALLPVLS